MFAILGIHPHEAGTTTEADVAEVRELLAHPRAVAVGETGLDWFRDYAPHDAQQRLFAQQLALAAELGQARRDPHARRRRRHARGARRFRRPRRAALLLVAAPARAGARARLVRLVRRKRDVPESRRPAARGDAGARRPDPRRDRLPLPRAATGARPAQRARVSSSTPSPRSRRRAARTPPSWRRTIERNAAECFGLPA